MTSPCCTAGTWPLTIGEEEEEEEEEKLSITVPKGRVRLLATRHEQEKNPSFRKGRSRLLLPAARLW